MSLVKLKQDYKEHKRGEKISVSKKEAKQMEKDGIGEIEVDTIDGKNDLNEETKGLSKFKTK